MCDFTVVTNPGNAQVISSKIAGLNDEHSKYGLPLGAVDIKPRGEQVEVNVKIDNKYAVTKEAMEATLNIEEEIQALIDRAN